MMVRLLILVQDRIFADALATRLEAEQDLEVVAALHAGTRRHICSGEAVRT